MARLIYFLMLLTMMTQATAQETTIYLIRHAEKADATPDTSLSESGSRRAEHWADYFRNIPIDLVLSTPYKRTQQTCAPLAAAHHLEIVTYDPKILDLPQLISQNPGKTILITGHSNTIPKYINELLGQQKYPDIPESEFGNLYVLKIRNGKVSDELLHP